ncbi:MAG: CBS domain-containing protein [Planctomycetaceae bacterium]|jgi:CBS domain-containing protein|nr:CBS domain-containing protein [Planctomycetaceae bacterium]MBV8558250.1 CBS domain-containing protein [Planctomycetaceae bacterium]MBV8677383.1 CBS domain-containing protein [Planctomycetaceae bacterium]
MLQVRDVLKTKPGRVITIELEATVQEAVARLVQNNIGSLPVVDAEGRLVGVYSERDVLRGIHNRGAGLCRMPVSEVMTHDPVTCAPDDDVDDVMGKMTYRRIAKVPVLEHDRLVGIISVGDIIKYLYDRVCSENEHLMTYIHSAR